MFVLPSLVTLTIAATRIYRSLSDFASHPNTYEIIFIQIVFTLTGLCHRSANDFESGNPSWQRSSRLVSTNKDTAVVHIPSDRLEVSMHTTHEEHPMSHLADKPHELGFGDDVEDQEGK